MEDNTKNDLKKMQEKPLVKSPLVKNTESNEISKIIKPLDKVVDSGKPIKDNKIVRNTDTVSTDELTDMLSKPIDRKYDTPDVIDKSTLSSVESNRLMVEESRRRKTEKERRDDVNSAYKDELERRKLQSDKIQLMKDEFQLFLKKTYPNIVGNRYIKDSDISSYETSISNRKRQIQESESKLQKNKIERLEREKLRKSIENNFQLNKLTSNETQTFFENDVLLEQRFKIETNPEIENLSYVKQTQKDIRNLEYQMGRRIVSHRDIVESEESDFDTNALTNSNDILVLTQRDVVTREDIEKQQRLLTLREQLKSYDDTEEIYILKN
jgi:hypothetical protein